MVAQLFKRFIRIAVIHHRTIIARHDNQGILCKSQFIQGLQQFTHAPIELGNRISPQSHRALPPKAVMRETRHMNIIRGKIHKERLILMSPDKVLRMDHNRICNILIFPQRFSSAFHIPDPADSVHDRHIMPETRLQVIKQLRIIPSGRFAFEILLITYLNRSRRVIIRHLPVLNKHTRDTVTRSRHNIVVIKS